MSRERDGDVDLDTLRNWRPEFRNWKSWDDVPTEHREVFATKLEAEADGHSATSQRCVGVRPQQQQFEQMWAYVARLAAGRLR